MSTAGVSFAIALPPEWQSIDLLSEQPFDGPLGDAIEFAARGSDEARLLMLRSLVALTPSGEPLAAGLSVIFADRSAPVSSAPLRSDALDGADVAAVSLPAGAGLRVRHVALATVPTQAAPVAVLRVQYLIETAEGLLTMTFTTPQAARTEAWEQLFDALAETAELGVSRTKGS